AVEALIAKIKPDVVRVSYEEFGGGLLGQVKLGAVKRIALIGKAARAFHGRSDGGANNGLKSNEDLSLPEVIILDRQPDS
ncbi:MAG: hypothetical protein ACI82I_003515, partial [Gammaproteobacteria bacterium]